MPDTSAVHSVRAAFLLAPRQQYLICLVGPDASVSEMQSPFDQVLDSVRLSFGIDEK